MKANLDKNLAPAWVSGKSYSTGEFCLYNKRLYICTTDNSDAEFDNSKWERRNLVDLVSGINSNLGNDSYYVKGQSQADGVGEYTFTAPIDGSLYIVGWYSTLGFYVKVNGTLSFKLTGASGSQTVNGRTVSDIKKGDTVAVYCQGTYMGVLSPTIENTFDTNLS